MAGEARREHKRRLSTRLRQRQFCLPLSYLSAASIALQAIQPRGQACPTTDFAAR
jgi:hypothetical protein